MRAELLPCARSRLPRRRCHDLRDADGVSMIEMSVTYAKCVALAIHSQQKGDDGLVTKQIYDWILANEGAFQQLTTRSDWKAGIRYCLSRKPAF